MEVHLGSDLEVRLSRVAAAQKRTPEKLIEEAVARLVDDLERFPVEAGKGLGGAPIPNRPSSCR